MHITNRANLPDAIVKAVTNDPYPHGRTGDISVTRLIGPPQIRVLERIHQDEIEGDAADRIWALVGQIGHGILERAETVAITEQRLFAEVEGWQVSGQFDRLALLPNGTLQDYKITSVWSVIDNGAKPDWIAQLNVLRWLAAKNDYDINKLQVVAILRDWSKGKARQGGNYPPVQVRVLDVPVWSAIDCDAYIRDRVHLHQLAEIQADTGRPLPECTAEERWAKPDVWAVKKPGRKSAVKLYDSQNDAGQHAREIKNGYIEHRPGESVRCADYCAAAPFCRQWQAMQQQAEVA